MQEFSVYLYKEKEGASPVWDWLRRLPRKAYAKAVARIERLQELGHQLRRPEADYLRDGIYELRWRLQSVNYRLLYFFYDSELIILAHGLTKEDQVPERDIQLALKYKEAFTTQPAEHILELDV